MCTYVNMGKPIWRIEANAGDAVEFLIIKIEVGRTDGCSHKWFQENGTWS